MNYEAYEMEIILFSGDAWTDVVTSNHTPVAPASFDPDNEFGDQ